MNSYALLKTIRWCLIKQIRGTVHYAVTSAVIEPAGASPSTYSCLHLRRVLSTFLCSHLSYCSCRWNPNLQPLLGHFLFDQMSNLCFHILCDSIKMKHELHWSIFRKYDWILFYVINMCVCDLMLIHFHLFLQIKLL